MIKNLLFLGSLFLGVNAFGQTVLFQENFDTPATQGLWSFGDLDGDEQTWEYLNAEANELPTFSGDAAFSFSWYLDAFTPDNTLTSPPIQLPSEVGLSLKFKVAAGDNELFEEHYAVYVIPANTTFQGTETPVFEETLDAGYYEAAKLVTLDISEFSGQNVQIVFRHYDCEDIFYVAVDDVMIEQTALSTIDFSKSKPIIYQDQNKVKIKGLDDVNQVKVFDLTGKKLIDIKAKEVDTTTLSKGIYIVNFYGESEVISKKIVIK